MKLEIERKFLVVTQDFLLDVVPLMLSRIRQGFLSLEPVVRIRSTPLDSFLTIKGKGKLVRKEFEYKIPQNDAEELLGLCVSTVIEKTRYHCSFKEHIWEVDVFMGENMGLVLAEIELTSEDEKFEKPSWVGTEVTDDSRYANVNLSRMPYSKWRKN
jgi:CYTH domain-containing protein